METRKYGRTQRERSGPKAWNSPEALPRESGAPSLLSVTLAPAFIPGLATTVAPVLILADISAADLIEKIKQYVQDPKSLVTGPTKTGSREDAVKSWKEHCSGPEKSVDKDFAKRAAKYLVYYWDRVGTGEDVWGRFELMWSYDCCNIYDATVTWTQEKAQNPDECFSFALWTFEIPEAEPVELAPCKPCTPKCLKVRIDVYVVKTRKVNPVPGIKRKMGFNIEVCASCEHAVVNDLTDYTNSHGEDDGTKPNAKIERNKDYTWGLDHGSKIEISK
jgi:hypothetical protein